MRIVQHISHTVFQENSYILYKNDRILIIDPGDAPEYYENYIPEGMDVVGVLATHAHVDHIISAAELCNTYHCPFIMNAKDTEILNALELSCKRYNLSYYGTPHVTMDISGSEHLNLGGFGIRIFHTPGHTPGSVCFYIDKVLFSGDTLFHRSVGRADLPGGDHQGIIRSIKALIAQLPDGTDVYPGHMGETTVGDEKKYNPFIVIE